ECSLSFGHRIAMVARGGCLSLPLVADRLVGNRPMSGGEIDALAETACRPLGRLGPCRVRPRDHGPSRSPIRTLFAREHRDKARARRRRWWRWRRRYVAGGAWGTVTRFEATRPTER